MAVKFINRTKELREIESLAKKQNNCSVMYIVGSGGVGKTRLLQHIPELLSTLDENFRLFDILDFDDRYLMIATNLERKLLEYVGEEEATSVRDELHELDRIAKVRDSQDTQERQKERIISTLATAMNSFFEERVILLFDTVEKLNPEVRSKLVELISNLDNALCILSGRPEKDEDLWGSLTTQFKGEQIKRVNVEPFDKLASKEYLVEKEKELSAHLSSNQAEILITLSRGRPILIDLAIDFVARTISIDGLLELTSKEFLNLPETKQQEIYQQFEKQLVRHVKEIRGQMDRLLLVLSRIYPLTLTTAAYFLNLPPEDIKKLFEDASKSVFIKVLPGNQGITLHDEMRRLIREHVWESLDPDQKRRRRDSQIAMQIFKKKDEELRREKKKLQENEKKREQVDGEINDDIENRRRERELVTEIWLEHALYVDLEKGFEEVVQIINRVRFNGRKYEFAQRLCDLIEPYSLEKKLSSNHLQRFAFFSARSKMDLGKFEQAASEFSNLLSNSDDSVVSRSGILNMLGVIEERQGNLSESLDYQSECRRLLPSDEKIKIAGVENQLGYLHRLLMDHGRENLTTSIEHYKTALKTAREWQQNSESMGEQDSILLASIHNNLGYAYGLQEDYERAKTYCDIARLIYENNNKDREIASVETTLGILERNRDAYDRSMFMLNRAISRLKLPDDHAQLCKTYFHLGWTQWFVAEADDITNKVDFTLLIEGMRSLERSRKIAEDYRHRQELPGIYHQLASVYWRVGRLEQNDQLCSDARELNDQALEISRSLDNIRYSMDALVGKAEFDLDDNNPDQIQDYRQELETHYREHGHYFPLYHGRLLRILGDFAFRNNDLEEAFSNYRIGISQINIHGGFGPFSIEREIKNLADKIDTLPKDIAIQWLTYLREAWEESNDKSHRDLGFWCEQQLIKTQIIRP